MVVVRSIEDWSGWLAKNHLRAKKAGMISYKKHTGEPFVGHREAMIEAIRFGWIDTTINKLDDKRFVRYFVRRGDNANWSRNTLRYAAELEKKGMMSPHGLLRYRQGMKKKPHDHGIPDNPKMPAELARALDSGRLKKAFEAYAPSYRKTVFRWILKAKQPETKQRRIKAVVKAVKGKTKLFPAA